MRWTPRVSVAAIVERDGRFLVVEERIEGRDVLNQPAGHLEDGESLLAAAVRETLEETAWHFLPEGLTGIYRYRAAGRGLTFLRFCFYGTVTGHEPQRTLDAEIQRVTWVSRDELARHRDKLRTPMVLRCIDDYLAGARYPLALLTDL
jgi:8-oxo-dGTP pyrophosphatase MutT (NUDIX family)